MLVHVLSDIAHVYMIHGYVYQKVLSRCRYMVDECWIHDAMSDIH